jgi:hypothetical protein
VNSSADLRAVNRKRRQPMLTDHEYRALLPYAKGGKVDEKHRNLLNKYASLGMVRFGFSDETGEVVETARLTERGRRQVWREAVYRSPVKRFFYSVANRFSW